MIKNREKIYTIGVIAVLAVSFAFFAFLNFKTFYLVDDFGYMLDYSADFVKLKIWKVFKSIHVHYYCMNGRSFAHFTDQVFMTMPKAVFNVINAAVMSFVLYLINRFSGKKVNPVLLVGSIFIFWAYMPVLGQTCLWQTGSCNYLWAYMVSLCFMLVYADKELAEKLFKKPVGIILFLLFCVLAGGWSENCSSAAVASAFFILVTEDIHLFKNIFGKKTGLVRFFGLVCACLGYLYMVMSPAEGVAKIKLEAEQLQEKYDYIVKLYHENFQDLLTVWVIVFVLAAIIGTDWHSIRTSFFFIFASAFSMGLLIAASYISERSMGCVCIYIIAAIMTAAQGAIKTVNRKFSEKKRAINWTYKVAYYAIIIWFCINAFSLVNLGVSDIISSNERVLANDAYIREEIAKGSDDVTIPFVYADTPYSPVYSLKYIDTENPSDWPNGGMALYYEISTIRGTK